MNKSIATPLLDLLLANDAFSRVRKRDISRLILFMNEQVVSADEVLIEKGAPANDVFLIIKGKFLTDAPDGKTVEKYTGFIGAEAALGAAVYHKTLRATDPGCVMRFPAKELDKVAGFNPQLKSLLFESFTDTTLPTDHVSYQPAARSENANEKTDWQDLTGWITLPIIATLIIYFSQGWALNANAVRFLVVVSAAATMWVFALVPAFVPPLFSLLAVILFDIAPAATALSGFTSGTFFMCMSVFAIGAMVLNSGLAFRLMLKLMVWLPTSRTWYSLMLWAAGVLMTLVIPSPAGRMAMVSPVLINLIESSDSNAHCKYIATQFICSTMSGVILFATIFMAGKPSNLILYGMFDGQTQFAYQWLNWLGAASFTGAVLLVLYVGVFLIIFRTTATFSISRQVVASQLKLLGPISNREWGSVAALLALGVGVLAVPFHKMEISWLTLGIAVMLLSSGILGPQEFRKYIDWPLLLFIGAIIAWVPIMESIGLTTAIADRLVCLSRFAVTRLPTFIGVLCLLIVVSRLILPTGVTVVLFATATFPIAKSAGITPWIFAFIILLMCEAHIFAYQNPFSMQLRNQLIHQKLANNYNEKKIILFNLWMIAIRVAAIYLSLPFWKYLDVL